MLTQEKVEFDLSFGRCGEFLSIVWSSVLSFNDHHINKTKLRKTFV